MNQSLCLIPRLVIGWFFRFCFRLRRSSFHWTISDGVVNGIGRNGNVLILPTSIPPSLWPLTTLIFHWVVSSLTTPTTIPTTPSLMKTSLEYGTTNYNNENNIRNTNNIRNMRQTKKEDITWRFGNTAMEITQKTLRSCNRASELEIFYDLHNPRESRIICT